MQTIITEAQTSGDVLLKSTVPSNGSPYTTFEPEYLPVIQALAISNSCGYLAVFDRCVSYTVSNGYGYYSDGLHPSNFGYSAVAQAVFDVPKTL
jgi:lysophospholipase L1-like esterase